MSKPAAYSSLNVKVIAPYKTYYNGRAESVSAANKVGPFDVLPGHANFFSILTAGKVIIRNAGQALEFSIPSGIIKVSGNQVVVFTNV